MPLPPFDELLEESIALHGGHGCPGQVLGVKLAMVGLREIGIDDRVAQRKQFLVYVELDRCAADAIQAATGCRVGRRALKVIDYGVMAATFVRLDEDRAVRVIAREDSRQSVDEFTTVEGTKYERQTDAYKHMPEELLFDTQRVSVTVPEEDMPGPPVSRVQCELCGDHVQDRREIRLGERVWCRACSGGAYYSRLEPLHSGMLPSVGRISRSDAVVRHTPLGVPTIGIAGKSKSGKTTLVEGLV
ncbi:MAG TPA: FmdE family protein, partial [Armatimonadota bacterium]|nr:FmdE family protein [Armatimonadota bacterium]